MIDKSYLVRDAAALLKLARSTSDPSLATALIDNAAELKTRIDEADVPDVTPVAPDVEPPPAPSQEPASCDWHFAPLAMTVDDAGSAMYPHRHTHCVFNRTNPPALQC